jgi:hypothetical protein
MDRELVPDKQPGPGVHNVHGFVVHEKCGQKCGFAGHARLTPIACGFAKIAPGLPIHTAAFP